MLNDRTLDTLLADANPIADAELHDLPLDAAEADLRARLRREPPARRTRRLRPAFAAVAAGAAALLVLILLPGRDDASSGTAWAAPLVKLAESSPLLLLEGWDVTRADETDEVEGEMTFADGSRSATLHWRHGPLEDWQKDRADSSPMVTSREVLGARAQVSQTGSTDYTALWSEEGRVLEFRAVAPDLAEFDRLLAALERVDVDTWLSAMPASVIKGAQRPAEVREMLDGIPLPPGFDAERLETGPLKDRYQLGAIVTGAVACAWIERWHAARERGDGASEREAEAAMATSREWKILRDMKAEGDWPAVMWEMVEAMGGDGTYFGRPVREEAKGALGCDPPLG